MSNKITVGDTNIKLSAASIGLPMQRSMTYSSDKGSLYLPFSGFSVTENTNNLYPQFLAYYYNNSPTHSASINIKAKLLKGLGFDLSNTKDKFKKWLNSINEDAETIDDILSKTCKDYVLFGGCALAVGYSVAGQIISVRHIPFTQVRCGKPEKGRVNHYVVSNNWDNKMGGEFEITEVFPKFNPSLFNEVQRDENGIYQPTDEQQSNAEQLIYWFEKSPDSTSFLNYYPLPDYISGVDTIATEIDILAANKSLLSNGFGSKTICKIPYKPETETERRELDYDIKRSFTGSLNNGGVVTVFALNGDTLPEFENYEGVNADNYKELTSEVKRSICIAHSIPPIMVGVDAGGGFNNRGEEMQTAFSLFSQTYISDLQSNMNKLFNKIISFSPYEFETLSIIPFKLIPFDEFYKNAQSVQTNNETSITTN